MGRVMRHTDSKRRMPWSRQATRSRGARALATAREKLADAQLDEKAAALAAAARERLADAQLDEKAAALAAAAREKLADSGLDDRASALAAAARQKISEHQLDEKAAALAARVRDAEVTQEASARARRATEAGLLGLGSWLQRSGNAERLGLARRRRRWPVALAFLLGAGVGLGVAQAGKRRDQTTDDLFAAADRLNERAGNGAGPDELIERIKRSLDEDPRTADLPDLSINVSDGTVFVRGAAAKDVDSDAIRDVVSAIPGVSDVDVAVNVLS